MDVIYYFIVDNASTLAPITLAACWYGLVVQVISTDDDTGCPHATADDAAAAG